MNPAAGPDFQWVSPLGVSRLLFLVIGALYLLIGVLAPFMIDAQPGRQVLFASHRTDAAIFGEAPIDILNRDATLARLRTMLYFVIAAMLVMSGALIIALAWFGLRDRQAWALAALAVSESALLPYWFLILRPYFQPTVAATLSDLPPFIWIPALLFIPATILGLLGLQ